MKEKEFWKYDSAKEDSQSYLAIRKLEKNVVHISVYNISLNGETFDVSHIPIDYDILKNSLKEKIINNKYEEDDSFSDGFNNWKESNGGIWEKPVKEVIKYIKETVM